MNPAGRSRPARLLLAGVVVLVALEATVAGHYAPKFPWHHLPGYPAVIALAAVAALVYLGTGLARAGLQRPERDDD